MEQSNLKQGVQEGGSPWLFPLNIVRGATPVFKYVAPKMPPAAYCLAKMKRLSVFFSGRAHLKFVNF